jgi:hypothetical protein
LTGPTDTELDKDDITVVALALFDDADETPVPVTGAECVCVTAVEFSEQMVVYVV